MKKHSDLSKADQRARLHFFHEARAKHPDHPVLALWMSALRTVHFRRELTASVKSHAKRSKAAKKAWKARKSQMLAA